ncbi:MAG: hypothetical protein RSA17_04565, partial [Ruthenibacterium sp.]
MRKFFARWAPLAAGLAISALGVVAAVWSQRVVQILPLLLGLVLLALGLWDSYNGFCSGGKTPLGLPRFAQGILDIMVAMVLILNRGVSVAFLGVVLGLW